MGKKKFLMLLPFHFPALEQSASASIIQTILNLEGPKMDSLFCHVLFLQVSHTFLIQAATTNLPGSSIIQSNTNISAFMSCAEDN